MSLELPVLASFNCRRLKCGPRAECNVGSGSTTQFKACQQVATEVIIETR